MRGRGEKQGFLRLYPGSGESHNHVSQDLVRAADQKLIELVKALARAAAERDFKQLPEHSGRTE